MLKKAKLFLLIASIGLLFSCNNPVEPTPIEPTPESNIVNLDFYSFNDNHGVIFDSTNSVGLARQTTYLEKVKAQNENNIVLSCGDMWQGSVESYMTHGQLMTEWMNKNDFVSMTLGNHEYDWGEANIIENSQRANFPYLGINIFSRETDKRVDYVKPSVVVEKSGVRVGIIGCMGDCYDSIAETCTKNVYFVLGDRLDNLIKDESTRLRTEEKCDIVVLALHYEYNSFLIESLTKGYIDLVFEGHSHSKYTYKDNNGVYHIQNSGESKCFSHLDADFDTATKEFKVKKNEFFLKSSLSTLNEDTETLSLIESYSPMFKGVNDSLGKNTKLRSQNELGQIAANLYKDYGTKIWGNEYEIFGSLAYVKTRSPYNMAIGDVTYSNLFTLFPFDDNFEIIRVKGRVIQNYFMTSTASSYYDFISYTEYGMSVKNNIDPYKDYYCISDNYTSQYDLFQAVTLEIDYSEVYLRDLFADYIKAGGLS